MSSSLPTEDLTMTASRLLAVILLLLSAGVTPPALAQADAHEADRTLLRNLLSGVEKALNEHDVDAVVPFLHPQVVITYQNAEVSRGVEEAKAFYTRMLTGPDPVVKDFSTRAEVSAPAVFYDNTAVAHGTTREHYTLVEGLDFTLDTRWTATVSKEGEDWKVASLHFSTNLFDNPILAATQQTVWMAAGGGLLIGVVLMFILGRLRRR
jgi:ketosteroid isomerase-like protein